MIKKGMRFPAIVLLAFSLLAGCASPTKRAQIDPAKSAALFPDGSYVHEVKLDIRSNPDPSKRRFEFRGAVRIAPDTVLVVGLSPIGTTLFRMSENRATGKITIESSVPQLKPFESRIAGAYASLHVLLATPRHPKGTEYHLDEQGRPTSFETTIEGRPTEVTFADYDEHEIPTELRVENAAFSVAVKVVGYEL